MVKAPKKTKEELIAYHESEIKRLKQDKKTFSKDMPGVLELIAALELVVKENDISYIDVIMGLSKMKRTGLTITKLTRKPKAIKVSSEDKPE